MERARRREEVDSVVLEHSATAGADPGRLVYIALGSNLGDREATLRAGMAAIGEVAPVAGASGVYETEAHTLPGQAPQPPFLNAVLAVAPVTGPREMMDALLRIEAGLGRRRAGRQWAAREIDLDILLHGDRQVHEAGLVIPHPRLALRRFVLAPLAEIAPDVPVPGTGATVAELLERCADATSVVRTDIALIG